MHPAKQMILSDMENMLRQRKLLASLKHGRIQMDGKIETTRGLRRERLPSERIIWSKK